MFLSQRKYVTEILERAHMVNCNSWTPVDTESKLKDDGHLVSDLTLYQSLAEYRGVANVVVETCWLKNLLHELHTPLFSATLVYYDNVRVLRVHSPQYADIFTKSLPSALFEKFRTSFKVSCPPLNYRGVLV
uniref:Uncharacterized protein n=1 Tax=Tanacetum cinerariifolium TaxID=118510 RepID=A0A699GQ17_TANCI|nr:hypothetical protein [Tanacetum cinerariifolium]